MLELAERRAGVENIQARPLPKSPYVSVSEFTSTSPNHCEVNHDSKRVSVTDGFAVVSDGLGKSINPHRASKVVTRFLGQRMRGFGKIANVDMVAYAMRFAFEDATTAVMQEVPGGKATATAIKIVENDGQKFGVIGHVGDSRLGILRKDGTFEYITHDDTAAGQQGLSSAFDAIDTKAQYDSLPDDMKPVYDQKTKCTQKMGEPNIPHVYTVTLFDGDIILLASDGVHDNLKTEEIVGCLQSKNKNKAKVLTSKARKQSQQQSAFKAKNDDITVVVMEVISQQTPVHEIVRFKKRRKAAKSSKK